MFSHVLSANCVRMGEDPHKSPKQGFLHVHFRSPHLEPLPICFLYMPVLTLRHNVFGQLQHIWCKLGTATLYYSSFHLVTIFTSASVLWSLVSEHMMFVATFISSLFSV